MNLSNILSLRRVTNVAAVATEAPAESEPATAEVGPVAAVEHLAAGPTDTELANDPLWIGRRLLAQGKLTKEQLFRALETHKERGAELPLAETLEMLQLVTPQRVAQMIAERHFGEANAKKHYIEVVPTSNREIARRLPQSRAEEKLVLPFDLQGSVVHLAVADPQIYGQSEAVLDFPEAAQCHIWVTPREEVRTAIDAVWSAPVTVDNPQTFAHAMICTLIEERASDAHMEPKGEVMVVRKRIDGRLTLHANIGRDDRAGVVQAVEIMANMDFTQADLPQEGMFKIEQGARRYTCRVSTCTTIYGKKVAIRLFVDDPVPRSFKGLGMATDDIATFERMLKNPHGGLMFTGPMGSGKSTLMRSAMSTLPLAEMNVTMIEDPPEQEMPAINQIPVDERKGRTFEVALKSALRQDIDVLGVGELRDLATARIAIKGALSGCLLFCTLHTNSAPGAVTRLIEMGVEPYLIPSAFNMIVAQRLVKKLCVECRGVSKHDAVLKQRFGIKEGQICDKGPGCKFCDGTGYRDRVGLFEVLVLKGNEKAETDEDIRRVILAMGNENNPATEVDLRNVARAAGMRTLREDGLRKVAQGITTIEEVLKETEL